MASPRDVAGVSVFLVVISFGLAVVFTPYLGIPSVKTANSIRHRPTKYLRVSWALLVVLLGLSFIRDIIVLCPSSNLQYDLSYVFTFITRLVSPVVLAMTLLLQIELATSAATAQEANTTAFNATKDETAGAKASRVLGFATLTAVTVLSVVAFFSSVATLVERERDGFEWHSEGIVAADIARILDFVMPLILLVFSIAVFLRTSFIVGFRQNKVAATAGTDASLRQTTNVLLLLGAVAILPELFNTIYTGLVRIAAGTHILYDGGLDALFVEFLGLLFHPFSTTLVLVGARYILSKREGGLWDEVSSTEQAEGQEEQAEEEEVQTWTTLYRRWTGRGAIELR